MDRVVINSNIPTFVRFCFVMFLSTLRVMSNKTKRNIERKRKATFVGGDNRASCLTLCTT